MNHKHEEYLDRIESELTHIRQVLDYQVDEVIEGTRKRRMPTYQDLEEISVAAENANELIVEWRSLDRLGEL